MVEVKARSISKGVAEGELLVSSKPVSFYGGVDPNTGVVTDAESDIKGQSIAGKILVFPTGKGSTVGSYTLYRLKKNGKAPAAIINGDCETICAVGGIISDVPLVDKPEGGLAQFKTGARAKVDASNGVVTLQ
jgi:predicted aconitase with swiveling domain